MSELYTGYEACHICPRNCSVNRNNGEVGFCRAGKDTCISSACLHFGEEPPITAEKGSGTIFITGCNLHCAFCQNYQISQKGMGKSVSSQEFANICLRLEESGAENINIVTGSHAIPSIAKGLEIAKIKNLSIPVCWNTSSYETVESISMLEGLVDIWLPDLKTLNPMISNSVCKAPDYPKIVKKAIRKMLEISPLTFDSKQIATPTGAKTEKMLSGVIIRHLVLPGRLSDTKIVLDWLKKTVDTKACISLMSQYTPVDPQKTVIQDELHSFSKIELEKRSLALSSFQDRLINKNEFKKITSLIDEYEFSHLFYQELEENTEWLPDFSKEQPFSNALAKPIWHYKKGFIS